MITLKKLAIMLADLKEKEGIDAIKDLVNKGEESINILEVCKSGMELVGRRYETSEYFIADMIMAAEIFNEVMEIVRPKLEKAETKYLGIF